MSIATIDDVLGSVPNTTYGGLGVRQRGWRPNEGTDWQQSTSGLYLPSDRSEHKMRQRLPIAVSLFAGAGGFDLGFIQAGGHVVGATDSDPYCALTYLVNLGGPETQLHFVEESDERAWSRTWTSHFKHQDKSEAPAREFGSGYLASHPDLQPTEHYWLGDVRKLTGERMLADMGLRPGELGCVMGGPPCQGFSAAGKRNVYDECNSLVFEFARLVLELGPQTMCMENVPGIVSMVTERGTLVLDELCRILERGEFGSFDALRKGLLMSSGAGVVTKARNGTGKPRMEINAEFLPEGYDEDEARVRLGKKKRSGASKAREVAQEALL